MRYDGRAGRPGRARRTSAGRPREVVVRGAITTLTAITTASQPRPPSTGAWKTTTFANSPSSPGGSPARQSRKKRQRERGQRLGARQAAVVARARFGRPVPADQRRPRRRRRGSPTAYASDVGDGRRRAPRRRRRPYRGRAERHQHVAGLRDRRPGQQPYGAARWPQRDQVADGHRERGEHGERPAPHTSAYGAKPTRSARRTSPAKPAALRRPPTGTRRPAAARRRRCPAPRSGTAPRPTLKAKPTSVSTTPDRGERSAAAPPGRPARSAIRSR